MKIAKSSWSVANIIAIIVLGVVIALIGNVVGRNSSSNEENVAGIEAAISPNVEKTITYNGQDGKNALDLLKVSHEVKTQDSTMGSFVTSIDQTENTDDTYWMLYVDGKLAPTSADQFQTKNGEKIEWRFETYQ